MRQPTVDELRKALAELDGDLLVVLSCDSEGNGYGPIAALEFGYRYSDGEIGLDGLTPDLEEQGYGEEDVMSHGEKAVVLWP